MARPDGETAARQVLRERWPDAPLAILAGSVARGDATASSDLDLVVVYQQLPHAYRESFLAHDWPVEAFVHDLDTLRQFFWDVDRPAGYDTLASMVATGRTLTAPHPLDTRARTLAAELQAAGPPALTDAELARRRYAVSDLVDDLRAPRDDASRIAAATALYGALAELHLRGGGQWAAKGKAIPRWLAQVSPAIAGRFVIAFDRLFRQGATGGVIAIAEEILAPLGGPLFDGVRLDAPPPARR